MAWQGDRRWLTTSGGIDTGGDRAGGATGGCDSSGTWLMLSKVATYVTVYSSN